MRKLGFAVFLLWTVVCGLWTTDYGLPTAQAEIPRLINYQGRLTDKEGKPVADASYSVTFRIFDNLTAGTLLWDETHPNLIIQKGIFSVLLGSVKNLGLAFDKPYFLEIKVGDDEPPLQPRQQIASAGYAIRAEKAENATQAQNANQAQNADTVANVGVSTTPQANKLLPLDSSAKLPLSAVGLKIYDSGWFAVSSTNDYSKTHNLGTTKLIICLYFSSQSNGSSEVLLADAAQNNNIAADILNVHAITTTTLKVAFRGNFTKIADDGSYANATSGYARVICIALE